jgi:hypothetical protein
MITNQASNIPTAINYANLAGPYFRVFVNGNSSSLPEWLAKQIKSVEITEVDAHSSDGQSVDMAVITMIDAYENVTDQSNDRFNAGVISSRPGGLLDLVITSNNQIRTLTSADLEARKMAYTQSQQTKPQSVPNITYNTIIEANNYAVSMSTTGTTTVSTTAQIYTLLNAINPLPNSTKIFNNFLTSEQLSGLTPFPASGSLVQQIDDTHIVVSGLPLLPVASSVAQDITFFYTETVQVPVEIPVNPAVPKFLFQEGNDIEIEWGYKTASHLKRKMKFVVQYVEYDAPENTSPEAKIYCLPQVKSDLSKLYPTKGLVFTNTTTLPSGNKQHHDLYAGSIVQKIASACGYSAYISKSIGRINVDNKLPGEMAKTMTPQDSVYYYLHRLAKDIGAHFFVAYSYKLKADTIFFLSDEDFSKYSIFNFVWKGPNTLLTSYNIKSDFSRIQSGSVSYIDPVNNVATSTTQEEATYTYALKTPEDTTKKQIVTQPTQVSVNINNLLNQGTSGISLYTPVNDQNAKLALLEKEQHKQEKAIILNGTLIGYPFVSPCVCTFTNIGKRYSGRYTLTLVKHILDNSGYKIQFNAMTNAITDSLVDSEKEPGDKDQPQILDVFNMKTGSNVPVATVQSVETSGTPGSTNFNSQLGMPGKVDATNSAGSNNGAQ